MKKLAAAALLIIPILSAGAEDDSGYHFRNWCYLGAGISYSMGSISYTGFDNNSNTLLSGYKDSTVKYSAYSPFIFTQLYGKTFMGEITAGLDFEKASESFLSHYNASFSASVRYKYTLSENLQIYAGPGIYLETYPSSKSYDGGGVMLSIGSAVDMTESIRIFSNIAATYGYYGVGDDSKKIGFRFTLGAGTKVGKF